MPPPPPQLTVPPSPGGGARPSHLQPLEGGAQQLRTSGGSLPGTPKSALAAAKAPAGGHLQHTDSELSLLSVQSVQQAAAAQQADDDNIKVVVRLRPLFPDEAAKGAASVVSVSDDCGSLQVVVPGAGGAVMQRDFTFHACLGPEVGQAQVMELCGIQQLLDAALAGYHVTIFAYGQTGSGKTHTMSGKEEVIGDDSYLGLGHESDSDGIVSRAVQYLFHQVHTHKGAKFSLKASYLEIYNEGAYDLVHFSPKAKSLPVKWDSVVGFYVQGLKVVPCSQQRTMMEVIRTGMKHRRVGSHQLNMESSRSHAIFTVYCDATPTDPAAYDFGSVRYGKVSFVDLAGSERVRDSKSEGVMLKETININKSLSVLGKVILALAERDASGTTAHVPYRDSTLTKLLMDSLGGSALTLMVACCSPSSLQVEETLSTLSYATRTKAIHNRPIVQYDPREAQISQLRREIELLRQENALLKEQLRSGGSQHSSLPTTPDGSQVHAPTKQAGRLSVLGLPANPSPGSSATNSPSPHLASLSLSPSPQPGSLHDSVAALRANSSPSLPHVAGLPGAVAAGADLRASLNDMDLRANAARYGASASGSGGGAASGALSSSELLRRLRETQALLIKFSEENSRLSHDNQKLLAGRSVLSSEHATVLDEIDLLRGKLSQLEHSVLAAAQQQQQPQAPAAAGSAGGDGGAAAAAAAAGASAAALDIRALLASVGLGAGVPDLPALGEGPDAAQAEREPPELAGAGALGSRSGARGVQQQPGASGSSAGGAAAAPAAGQAPSRSLLGSAAASGRPPGPSSARSSGRGLRSGSPAVGAKAVNRTPLHAKAPLEPADDAVFVAAHSPGLAVLLAGGARPG